MSQPVSRGRRVSGTSTSHRASTSPRLPCSGTSASTLPRSIPRADFLADPTVPTEQLVILNFRNRKELAVTNVQQIDSREVLGAGEASSDLPSSFVTLAGLRRHGWQQVASGWLIESNRPLTSEQIAAARDLAAEAGLTIEVKRENTSLATPIAIATAAGALLALAILAMTVGLIRSESAGDLRTLTATGATNRIRRTLTAATAGALALLGALLGVAGAYLALVAIYLDDLGYLGRIPIVSLVLIVAGVPLVATLGRLAPRRPRAARHRAARNRVTVRERRNQSEIVVPDRALHERIGEAVCEAVHCLPARAMRRHQQLGLKIVEGRDGRLDDGLEHRTAEVEPRESFHEIPVDGSVHEPALLTLTIGQLSRIDVARSERTPFFSSLSICVSLVIRAGVALAFQVSIVSFQIGE